MHYAFLTLLVASIIVALAKGGAPEKWGAATLIAMMAVQFTGRALFGVRYEDLDLVAFGVDLIGFASFTAIALFARRIWPLWASALQLFSLTTHFVRVVDGQVHPAVYWLMKSAPTLGVCLILIVAAILHRRHVRRAGSRASWKVWRGKRASQVSTPTTPRS